MKILVLHGPNLNMLGTRNNHHYGTLTLAAINSQLETQAKEQDVTALFFQSNHEGSLIDFLQEQASSAQGILINPGALTHYGYSLRDALEDTHLPIVEVHMSDIQNREDFRKIDVLDGIVAERIVGLQEKSYTVGLEKLMQHIKKLKVQSKI